MIQQGGKNNETACKSSTDNASERGREGGREGAGAMNRKSVKIWSRNGSNRGLYRIGKYSHVGD